jgi:hypothetical protein
MDERRFLLYNHKISEGNYKMKRGNRLEGEVINAFYEGVLQQGYNLGEIKKNEELIVLEDLKIGATPDAFLGDKTALLEVKTTEKDINEVILNYTLQVIWQLKCTGLNLGFIQVCQINKKQKTYLPPFTVSPNRWEHYELFMNEIETIAKTAWNWLETAQPTPNLDKKSDRIIHEILQMTEEQVEKKLYEEGVFEVEVRDEATAKMAEFYAEHNRMLNAKIAVEEQYYIDIFERDLMNGEEQLKLAKMTQDEAKKYKIKRANKFAMDTTNTFKESFIEFLGEAKRARICKQDGQDIVLETSRKIPDKYDSEEYYKEAIQELWERRKLLRSKQPKLLRKGSCSLNIINV